MKPYYDDGQIQIWHGDSLDVIPNLPKVALAVTDPPYVIGAVSAGNLASKAGTWGDTMNSARWFAEWYQMVAARLVPTGALWTCTNWRSLPVVMKAAVDAGLPVSSCAVWHKDTIGPGPMLRPSYEMVVLLPRERFEVTDRSVSDLWTIPWSPGNRRFGHPAEKPVRLMEHIISISQPDGIVLDPFAGSGTTLVAAQRLGLRAIGVESEERYCEVAARRLDQGVLDFGEVSR